MPSAHMNSNSKSIREQLLRRPDVNVLGSSRRRRMEVRMVGSKFPSEGYSRAHKVLGNDGM